MKVNCDFNKKVQHDIVFTVINILKRYGLRHVFHQEKLTVLANVVGTAGTLAHLVGRHDHCVISSNTLTRAGKIFTLFDKNPMLSAEHDAMIYKAANHLC